MSALFLHWKPICSSLQSTSPISPRLKLHLLDIQPMTPIVSSGSDPLPPDALSLPAVHDVQSAWCSTFKSWTVDRTKGLARKYLSWYIASCPSRHGHRHCGERHHSLLHLLPAPVSSLAPATHLMLLIECLLRDWETRLESCIGW